MDLKFPHHENEIAQTCAARGAPFANVWMHNGFVNVDDEKMSKSLGNFFTVREVLAWRARPRGAALFPASTATTAGRSTTRWTASRRPMRRSSGFYLALRGVPARTPGRSRARRDRAIRRRHGR